MKENAETAFFVLIGAALFAFGFCTGDNFAHFQERDERCRAAHFKAEYRNEMCVVRGDSTFSVPSNGKVLP